MALQKQNLSKFPLVYTVCTPGLDHVMLIDMDNVIDMEPPVSYANLLVWMSCHQSSKQHLSLFFCHIDGLKI